MKASARSKPKSKGMTAAKSDTSKKTTKRVHPGDVVVIKLRAKRFVFAKVATLQRDGVVLLLAYDHVSHDMSPPNPLPNAYKTQSYSWAPYITKGRWPVVGHASLTDDDLLRTLYFCGGDVFMGDKRVRKATANDFEMLPVQAIQFDLGLEQDLRKAFKL